MGMGNGWLNGTAKRIYSTAEAAQICNLSHKVIIRCFDNGKLRGFREQQTGFRRIPGRELRRFMKLCGYR